MDITWVIALAVAGLAGHAYLHALLTDLRKDLETLRARLESLLNADKPK